MPSYFEGPTFAVVPVLVGPLQALLALLPALLVACGAFLASLWTPAGMRRAGRFLWNQKLFSLLLLAGFASLVTGWPWSVLARGSRFGAGGVDRTGIDWMTFRGGAGRRGSGPDDRDPEVPLVVWQYSADPAVYSSPAVVGDTIVVSTAADISPFNPTGRGAIVALDVGTGQERWRYSPDDYRATFSSPVVGEGAVVCGEGLHQVQDARVTCLELDGRLRWEFRTASHVEATPAIADGRVFVGAGADGFYAFDLQGDGSGGPRVLWHLDGRQFPDCESSPLVVDDVVIFGLGEGGQAICAVRASDGEPLWRLATPYPVFASPTLLPATETSGAKLVLAMGTGNFVQSAEQVRDQKIEALRAAGAAEDAIEEARRALAPGGQVWCVDLATREVEWRYLLDDTVLGSIAERDDRLYFGSRDGSVHCLDRSGQVLRRGDLRAPIVCSPALGRTRAYVSTSVGRLYALDLDTLRPTWDASLGEGENFTSSPIVTHGHVVIGTQRQGLTCLGTTSGRRRAEIWRRGELGGAADQEIPPAESHVAGSWPSEDDRFDATAPLTISDGQVVAAGRMGGRDELVRLEFDADGGARVAWRAPAAIMAAHAPLAIGGRILTIEQISPAAFPDSATEPAQASSAWPHVVARHVETGEIEWRALLESVVIRGWTGDSRRVYLVGIDQVKTFEVRDGQPGWSLSLNAGVDAEPSFALADDVALVSDGVEWRALDSATGIELWRVDADGAAAGVLDAAGTQFLAVERRADGSTELQLRRLLDGGLVWRVPWSDGTRIAWGRLSTEFAVAGAPSGVWRLVRLTDGSLVELEGNGAPASSSGDQATVPPAGVLLFRSRVFDQTATAVRAFDWSDNSTRAWFEFAESGRAVTPLVASRGRVFFATERGKILCVGPRGAAP